MLERVIFLDIKYFVYKIKYNQLHGNMRPKHGKYSARGSLQRTDGKISAYEVLALGPEYIIKNYRGYDSLQFSHSAVSDSW